MNRVFVAFLVGLGGFVGTLTRYGVSGFCQQKISVGGGLFPIGTLAVNVIGCLGLGFLNRLLEDQLMMSPAARMALTVGFFGGLTTFSTFAFETMAFVNDGDWRMAILNFTLQNGLGLAAVLGGYRLAEKIF